MLQLSHEMPAAERIRKARTALLLDHPFFGSLLFRLKSEECHSIPTMATNGVVLRYNPAFVDTLNAATLAGVLAHEVMHPALQHHTRRSKRNPVRWNEACDYAVNPLLLDAGLSLPDDVLITARKMNSSSSYSGERRRSHSQGVLHKLKKIQDFSPGLLRACCLVRSLLRNDLHRLREWEVSSWGIILLHRAEILENSALQGALLISWDWQILRRFVGIASSTSYLCGRFTKRKCRTPRTAPFAKRHLR